MYKILKVKGRIRVPPSLLRESLEKAIKETIVSEYSSKIFKNNVLLVPCGVEEIGEGVIIPGDGAVYYEVKFSILAFEPELQEIVEGNVVQITEFGAFVRIGPIDGLVHISQVADTYMSYSKSGSLASKDGKKSLKLDDRVRARVIAVSMKSPEAKIGLTMRQPHLGKFEWIMEEKKKAESGKERVKK
ncbi:MAG: DNA-directed RNA polymerase [Candidatus Nanoarchaeia archaeon]|nr:DNA-directed RNA polymerase [Candidatus Haiyanarchaeum thermophilum]MCW1302961.1 DNA-directed RNA polymerase [Candidatus Haiyanarchaeum thermophilum]MCW1303639.1 DNA-directed RNA polymerase [Candidatus Haiyanarchaeum thermophilum]MCW1306320.1 DNA-directed RNA polymerase [Candidatus Haiyanarchaeum thermophilum]MCW1307170.1 DNA-directed RNA polymerase [Candidatus Haiyanarchaeum thermophilum]